MGTRQEATIPSFKILATPSEGASGEVNAIGATGDAGIFVAYINGIGFRYLDLSAGEARWTTAASFAGPVDGSFGLICSRQDDDVYVSVVEAPPRSWACFRIKSHSDSKQTEDAELVARSSSLPGDICAVCSSPNDTWAVSALVTGQVRFFDLHSGKAAGKGLKFEALSTETGFALARLGNGRAALVRGHSTSPSSLDFFVISFDSEARKSVLQLRGTLRLTSGVARGVLSAARATESSAPKDRLMLCWDNGREGSSRDLTFATVTIDAEVVDVEPLAPAVSSSSSAVCWDSIEGYFIELRKADAGLKLELRDARFGIPITSGEVGLALRKNNDMRITTAGPVTLLTLTGKGSGSSSSFAAVQWTLPRFSLNMVIGGRSAVATQLRDETHGSLAPLRELVAGKRSRDDAGTAELFSAKRHAGSDRALAEELKGRSWRPSDELVDAIIQHRCWIAARTMLTLPELDERLAVRLLVARPEFLSRVVRRARAPHLLDVALRDHLPAAMLPNIVEVLNEWLAAYADFPKSAIATAAPGIPNQNEIVSFLSAIANGCLPSLSRLDGELLERVLENLQLAQADAARSEKLYGLVRAACYVRKPMKAVIDVPVIEVALLEF